MKTDFYTKAVLTAIAVFLGILVFQNTTLVTPAQASLPAPVVATQNNGVMDVNIVQVNGEKIFSRTVLWHDGERYSVMPTSLEKVDLSSAINVNIANEPIDVRLVDYGSKISSTTEWGRSDKMLVVYEHK